MKSFLTADFGAGSLKLAEFETNESGGLRLKNFAIQSLGLEGSQEAGREKLLLKVLPEVMAEKGLKPGPVNLCAPGFQVFSKFVKLPPVDAGKVTQIIQYEAQQNVPFPLSEVVWDYQILGTAGTGELEVLLVAIKTEIVEGLFRIAEQSKLKLQICEASPAALCNAFRYNYGEFEDCSLLLDIGAKTSNVIFFEKDKVFSRSISLGANMITQDFANEAKLKFDEAERIKVAEGFVSLGGAYEEPENPHQAAISKIARQFMTKLHIQVNQTLQFYRGQQGGSAPQRVFLSGGASIMPYTAQFFAEKLNVPVEYFNPLRNVQIDPAVDLEGLSRVAHSLGEVVGLGLRNLAHCPVEMNLMPESTLRWQTFNQKKPYLVATVGCLVAVSFAVGYLYHILAINKQQELAEIKPKVEEMQRRQDRFDREYHRLQDTRKQVDELTMWLGGRFYWADVLSALRGCMITAEQDAQAKLAQTHPGVQLGVWVEQILPPLPPSSTDANGNPIQPGMQPGMPPGMFPGGMPGRPMQPDMPNAGMPNGMPNPGMMAGAPGGAATAGTAATTNGIVLVCRAIHVSQEDNGRIADAVEAALKNSPVFDATNTALTGAIAHQDGDYTFTFHVNLALANPPKF